MTQLPPQYNPKDIEERLYARWEALGLFQADPSRTRTPYTIVIPPPNVTGILHMGHALNNTIQDILIRFKRMQGANALWIPGTDHAGIATQNVVEKALAKEGRTRQMLGREAFIRRVWQWKEQYGNTIILQLKRLGASCDWQRTHFTMDAGLSEAVTEVFLRLHDAGLIYRGSYIVTGAPAARRRSPMKRRPEKRHAASSTLFAIRLLAQGSGLRVRGSCPQPTAHSPQRLSQWRQPVRKPCWETPPSPCTRRIGATEPSSAGTPSCRWSTGGCPSSPMPWWTRGSAPGP
jgi:valyl-tRNA synthetase